MANLDRYSPRSAIFPRCCDECSESYIAKTSKGMFCSSLCQKRHHYATDKGKTQQAEYGRRYRTRNPRPFTVECIHCGETASVTTSTARFCSYGCSVLWKREQRRGCTDLVHVGPMDVCHLPQKHPARRASAKPPSLGNGVSMFVSGQCAWCAGSFTALASSAVHAPRYCSKQCQRYQSRKQQGRRFLIQPKVRQSIYERDGFVCQLCDGPVDMTLGPSDVWGATLDHITCQSWTDSPDHSPDNLRLAHRWCNSVRSDESNDGHSLFAA